MATVIAVIPVEKTRRYPSKKYALIRAPQSQLTFSNPHARVMCKPTIWLIILRANYIEHGYSASAHGEKRDDKKERRRERRKGCASGYAQRKGEAACWFVTHDACDRDGVIQVWREEDDEEIPTREKEIVSKIKSARKAEKPYIFVKNMLLCWQNINVLQYGNFYYMEYLF